tara:strand:+ start:42 stop:674 length:633 start_codon:yes stop_codon:yes gene_type:complete
MTQQNPNKYRDNLPLLEKILKQYEANDLSRADALTFLQEQGFNLPPNLVETPAIPIVEAPVVPEPAPLAPLTLAEPATAAAALPAIPPAPREGTPTPPVNVLGEFSSELQMVAGVTTPVPGEVKLGVQRTVDLPAASSGLIPVTETKTKTTSQEQDLTTLTKLRAEELGIATEISDFKVGQAETEATEQLMRVRREKIQEEEFAQKKRNV